MDGANIYGPCDGLYYLYDVDFRAIWNPTINEVRTLPPPPITKPDPLPNTSNECYGFGLDPICGDYKVVAIKGIRRNTCQKASVLVYSLRNDSWKYCGNLRQSYYLNNNMCYIFIKGCFFWLGSFYLDENWGEIIITFDMVSDSIQELSVPDYQNPAQNTLGMHEDSLAFFSVREIERSLGIWTLNDGTWTKIFNIGPIPNICYPVGHWKSNKVIFVCNVKENYEVFLCDPNTREIKDLDVAINLRCDGIFAYMESLVSIKNKIQV